MWCLPLPPALRLLAPGFAARLGVILAAVAALVAARFVHDPRLAGHTVAVWGWLQRKIRRSAALAGRIAAAFIDSKLTPLIIIGKLEQYDYAGATAVAVVMLVISFVLLLVINALQAWQRRRSGVSS